MKFLMSCLAALCLVGCASTSTYQKEGAASDTEATATFIRSTPASSAQNLQIDIDTAKAATLANNAHVTLKVPEGKRAVRLDWPLISTQAKLEMPLEFKARTIRYFVVMDAKTDAKGLGDRALSVATNESIAVYEVPEQIATVMMSASTGAPANP